MNMTTPKKTHKPQRHIAVVISPGCVMLELVGFMDVFNFANKRLELSGCMEEDEKPYLLSFVAEKKGPVITGNGLKLYADYGYDDVDTPVDTLMIFGTPCLPNVMKNTRLSDFLNFMQPRVRRVVPICQRPSMLTERKLLNRRRASAHWNDSDYSANPYQQVDVEADEILIGEGNVYNSGTVTAGRDMALKLVEEDWGSSVASGVAQELRASIRRMEEQYQTSAFIIKEAKSSKNFHTLQTWIVNNPDADLSVESLAEKMAMSPRNFSRLFCRELGITPAKYVERIRLEAAKNMIFQTHLSVERVAAKSGFRNAEQMRRTFLRLLKTSPLDFRKSTRSDSHMRNMAFKTNGLNANTLVLIT